MLLVPGRLSLPIWVEWVENLWWGTSALWDNGGTVITGAGSVRPSGLLPDMEGQWGHVC